MLLEPETRDGREPPGGGSRVARGWKEAVMDPSRFDRWTRAVAATRSRRATLRGLAALGVAALAGRHLAAAPPVAAGGCAGFGCPCADASTCIDGLVCCGNSCQTS